MRGTGTGNIVIMMEEDRTEMQYDDLTLDGEDSEQMPSGRVFIGSRASHVTRAEPAEERESPSRERGSVASSSSSARS